MKKLFLLGISIALCACDTRQEKTISEDNPTNQIVSAENNETKQTDNTPSKTERKKELKEYFKLTETKGETLVEPKTLTGNSNGVYTYFRIKNGRATNLRLLIRYWSEKYIHAGQYQFQIDGKEYVYIPNKNKTGGTSNDSFAQNLSFQWFDNQINQTDLKFLEALGNAKEAKLHLIDLATASTIETIIFSEREKQPIRNALEYYKLLDGATIPQKGKVNIRQ